MLTVLPFFSYIFVSPENTVRIITYKQWAKQIATNFENHFWISRTKAPDEPNSHLVNRRGIYKDTCGSKKAPWTDYQLRPNFPIAIAVVCLAFLSAFPCSSLLCFTLFFSSLLYHVLLLSALPCSSPLCFTLFLSSLLYPLLILSALPCSSPLCFTLFLSSLLYPLLILSAL